MINTVRRRLSLEITGAALTAGIFAGLAVLVDSNVVSALLGIPSLERAGRAVVAGSCLVASLVHILGLAALIRCRITGLGLGLAVTAVALAVAHLAGALLAALLFPARTADYGIVIAPFAMAVVATVLTTPAIVRWVQAQPGTNHAVRTAPAGQERPQ